MHLRLWSVRAWRLLRGAIRADAERVIPGQRGPSAPVSPALAPGDLYLDSAVPVSEWVTVSCGDWTSSATHVWTGVGWSRLTPGPVRPVPSW